MSSSSAKCRETVGWPETENTRCPNREMALMFTLGSRCGRTTHLYV